MQNSTTILGIIEMRLRAFPTTIAATDTVLETAL